MSSLFLLDYFLLHQISCALSSFTSCTSSSSPSSSRGCLATTASSKAAVVAAEEEEEEEAGALCSSPRGEKRILFMGED